MGEAEEVKKADWMVTTHEPEENALEDSLVQSIDSLLKSESAASQS